MSIGETHVSIVKPRIESAGFTISKDRFGGYAMAAHDGATRVLVPMTTAEALALGEALVTLARTERAA